MKLIQAKLREMTSFYATELRGTFERIQQNEKIIAQSLMGVVEADEVAAQQGRPLSMDETNVLKELESKSLELSGPGNYLARLNELKMDAARWKRIREGLRLNVDGETLRALVTGVKNNENAIESLERVTKRVNKGVMMVDNVMSEIM
jgi:hypothetical protein